MPNVDAFFLPFTQGRRFCLLHSPPSAVPRRGAMLYIHPFAEEMNKSRRMAALQARSLAGNGWSVLQLDLFGCGDSDGDFGDADWITWVGDVGEAAAWLEAQVGARPSLWGLRAGCLLVAQAARTMSAAPDMLLWQPVLSGRNYLRQFLRVKLAGQMIADDYRARATLEQLQARLRAGETLEIGGYALSPALAAGLDAAELAPPTASGRVAWLEVSAGEPPTLPPAAGKHIDTWRAQEINVDAIAVSGLPFWQTQEIAECPALFDATAHVLDRWRA